MYNGYQLLAAGGIPGSQAATLAVLPLGASVGWTASDMQAFELDSGQSPRLEDVVLANRNDDGLPQPPHDARCWIFRRTNTAAVFAAPEIMSMVSGLDMLDAPIDAVCGADFDGDGDGDVIAMQSHVTPRASRRTVAPSPRRRCPHAERA